MSSVRCENIHNAAADAELSSAVNDFHTLVAHFHQVGLHLFKVNFLSPSDFNGAFLEESVRCHLFYGSGNRRDYHCRLTGAQGFKGF